MRNQDISIQPLSTSWVLEAAALVAASNAQPNQHAAQFGTSREDAACAITLLLRTHTGWFHVATRETHLVGLVGCEVDEAAQSAWVYGPYCSSGDWDRVSGGLMASLLGTIPPSVEAVELLFDAKNKRGCRLARKTGFRQSGEYLLLSISHKDILQTPPVSASQCQPSHYEAVTRLHAALFPSTEQGGEQLVRELDDFDETQILVVCDGPTLLGYVCFRLDLATGDGYIDYVGVQENARNRGVARKLLQAALHRATLWQSVRRVQGMVERQSVAMLGLCRQIGFEVERELVGYSGPRSDVAAASCQVARRQRWVLPAGEL